MDSMHAVFMEIVFKRDVCHVRGRVCACDRMIDNPYKHHQKIRRITVNEVKGLITSFPD